MQAAPQIVSFGCRLNTYESEVIRNHVEAAGLADTVVFNTCAVTSEAERQVRQAIRRMKRDRPEARIVVTGCAAQLRPERFAAMPEVARVVGNAEKMEAETWRKATPYDVSDIMEASHAPAPIVGGFEGLARAFVQVQTGCDHRCTFCIIPFGRGPSRSVPIGGIVAQVRALIENDYNEIVLTGVDIASFGRDLPGQPTLGAMLRRVLALVPECRRVRLSSLDPAAIDKDLWRLIAENERLMPHLHLSLQSASDMILKRMKRRHTQASARAVCRRIRSLRPDAAIGADLIAGFPTETDGMAGETQDFVEEEALIFLHVFPFSSREGTPAGRMPPVRPEVAKERAARLREAGARNLAAFQARRLGMREQVLVEAASVGRTAHYLEASIGIGHAVGAVVPLMFDHVCDGRLAAYV